MTTLRCRRKIRFQGLPDNPAATDTGRRHLGGQRAVRNPRRLERLRSRTKPYLSQVHSLFGRPTPKGPRWRTIREVHNLPRLSQIPLQARPADPSRAEGRLRSRPPQPSYKNGRVPRPISSAGVKIRWSCDAGLLDTQGRDAGNTSPVPLPRRPPRIISAPRWVATSQVTRENHLPASSERPGRARRSVEWEPFTWFGGTTASSPHF